MVRNFGERRKKKNYKKFKGKGPRGSREMEEIECKEVAIYVPLEQREAEKGKSKPRNNVYRGKRMERQRLKKERRKKGWGYVDYSEDEENDDDDGNYGGEYDEIIRTGPSRREAQESRESAQLPSSSTIFIDLDSRHGYNGCTRAGRRGYTAGHDNLVFENISLSEFLVMAIASRLSIF